MNNKKSYYTAKLLCYVLSIGAAFSILFASFFLLTSLTVSNEDYLQKYFLADNVTSSLSQELYEKFDNISEKYDIDENVLKECFSTDYLKAIQTSAMREIYTNNLVGPSKSTNMEKTCNSALEKYELESNKKISDKKIDSIVSEVEDAIDEVYTIDNVSEFSRFSSFFASRSFTLAIGFVFVAIVCCALTILISGRMRKSLNYTAMSILAAGEMLIVSSIFFLKKLKKLIFTDIEAYNTALIKASNSFTFILLIIGIVFSIIAIAIFVANYRYYSYKFALIDSEHEIEKNLI